MSSTFSALEMPKSRSFGTGRIPCAHSEDVLRLQVAVHHALLVRRGERREHLEHDVHEVGRREAPLPHEALGQGLAVQALHDEVRAPVVQPAHVVDRADVRVAERARDPRLVPQPRARLLVLGELRVQDLHRDPLPHREVLGLVHDAHPALAEGAPRHAVPIVGGTTFRRASPGASRARLRPSRAPAGDQGEAGREQGGDGGGEGATGRGTRGTPFAGVCFGILGLSGMTGSTGGDGGDGAPARGVGGRT